jgi:hypothetical protein
MLTAFEWLAVKLLLVAIVRVFAVTCAIAGLCLALTVLIAGALLRSRHRAGDGDDPLVAEDGWDALW